METKAELIRRGDLEALATRLDQDDGKDGVDDDTALLAEALQCNNPAAVALILKRGRAVISRDVECAALNAGVDAYRLVAAYPLCPASFGTADFDALGGSLSWAVYYRDLPLIRFLLEDRHVDPNNCPEINCTSPFARVARGSIFSRASTAPTAGPETPADPPDIARVLLANGADPAEPGLLYHAAAGDSRWFLELLVGECGVAATADDDNWETASLFHPFARGPILHYAAECGSARVVDYLVSVCGMHVDALDADGATPLGRARAAGRVEVVGLLNTLGAKH
ncbi:ankyrin repeat-containing domain protein [Zopfochytrium polystomum]|nr:ankyrin repeat-containing domain protein [Zopfochytrium polystomum]